MLDLSTLCQLSRALAALPPQDSSAISTSSPPTRLMRKRRRGEVANPANTLDGLVAQKMNGEPISSRFLCESDAIESPDDVIELKKMEADPDVCTRTCSVCGYQGKWVSEMIRHKRVHTNERPFKCKYCSRTSKWKADLIRHVAKTHGIRVVSKYSRTKSVDGGSVSSSSSEEIKLSPPHSSSFSSSSLSPVTPSSTQSLVYSCSHCNFDQEALSLLVSHLRSSHALSPYECSKCSVSFDSVESALDHSTACDASSLKANFSTVYPTEANPDTLPASSLALYTSGRLSSSLAVDIESSASVVPAGSPSRLGLGSPAEASPADLPAAAAALIAPYLFLLGQLPSAFTPTPTATDSLASLRRLQRAAGLLPTDSPLGVFC